MSDLISLFPVQCVVLKTIFGVPLDDDPHNQFCVTNFDRSVRGWYTEASYLRSLYNHGRSSIKRVEPGKEYTNVCLAFGRRAGKTVLVDSIARTEAYKGNREVLISSANKCITDQIRDEISYSVDRDHDRGEIESFNAGNTKIIIKGKGWRSRVDFVTHNRNAGKGTSYDTLILDEFDHFECPSAITPLARKNRILMSTPNPIGKDSSFYRLFRDGMESPSSDYHRNSDTLSLQIPTWEMNPTIPADHFKKEKARDPKMFDVEYGALFPSQTISSMLLFRKV